MTGPTSATRTKRWPSGRRPARESYLDMGRLLEAARASGAEAVHPGYGFLSENWRFAQRVRGGGTRLDRAPVAGDPGHGRQGRRAPAHGGGGRAGGAGQRGGGRDCRMRRARSAARVGYPVFLKAAAGGGGIGMARVADESALAAAFATAQRRSQAAFGTAALFVERFLEAPRHIEVQVMGDRHGARRAPARARVLDPAAPPEADRGDAGARAVRRAQRAPHGGGGERRARRRLRECGDDGVHRPGRANSTFSR